MAKARYYARFKKRINLKDPKHLNEKILWLSVNSDTREWTRLADKYAVREYVHGCGLDDILVPLYGVWDKAEEIDFNKLPQSFIMKSTNGSCSKDGAEGCDLYNLNGKIYFGEITFYHHGGFAPFHPEKWDYELGSWIKLPEKAYKLH